MTHKNDIFWSFNNLFLLSEEENPPIVKTSGGSIERGKHIEVFFGFVISYSTIPVGEEDEHAITCSDAVLARLATEKRLSLIKAWEENEKTKAENK